ncbi:unnamed protein product [Urochloa decumbens]|uniref:Uncharacterized protein n=1 Tax=Urochloa decumbens TaxID=240449 RepID=A0ABC9H6H0_9POAL
MEFATGALGTLLPKLGKLLRDEHRLQKSVKKNIEFLLRELESTHAALRKVGEVPLEQLDEQVRIWAGHARELSYDMEDIVDTFLVRLQGPEPPSKRSAKRFIKKMKDVFTKVKVQHSIGQEIKDIKERVKEIAERRDRYKVDDITPAKTVGVDPRMAYLYTEAADLVGIDEAREELITMLTKGDDTSMKLQRIVSVVGFGGLGKTTLAKAVHEKVKGKFNCTAFVPVGRNPDLKKVFKDILIDLRMHFNFEILDERQLIDKLREFLEKKRYFIVMDDVWDTKSWRTIKLALVENNIASRIIITTRTEEVAKEASEVYKLQPLSEDNSRKLFFARVSGGENKLSDHQPDEESDKILRKCGGIPLAVITMASLLVGKPREEWSKVNNSIGFGNKGNQQVEDTMKIISFSYYDLTSELRTCLLYLSVFPEDHFIEKTPLIWMWIAEGFVHEEQGTSSFEIGEGYFNQLVNRSMIQLEEKIDDVWYNYNDIAICGCRVHDMVLDLIRSISFEENFTRLLLDGNKAGASSSSTRPGQGKVRRLALQSDGTMRTHTEDMKQVRSFISHGCDIGSKGRALLSSFKFVRVLTIHTSGQRIEHQHLEPIWNLLHLRCLQLSGKIVELPVKEIATLKYLQTLDVDTTSERVSEQAAIMGLLTQLRCLRIRQPIGRIPDGIGKMTSLEELDIKMDYFHVEQEAWRGFTNELGGLRELRVLRITIPMLREDAPVHMVPVLRNLHKLEHLSLSSWSAKYENTTETWKEAEGGSLLLSRRLRQLFLPMIFLPRFPSLVLNASHLPNLTHLSLGLQRLDAQGDLRVLGELPELHYLDLRVDSTVELVRTSASDDDACLFRKLRRCNLYWYGGVRLMSRHEDSGGVSTRMEQLYGSMLLGSGRNKDVAPTLLPSLQKLRLHMNLRDFKDSNGSVSLEYFTSLHNVKVDIDCDDASAAEVEQVEVELRRAADVHPNRPTLEVRRSNEKKGRV